MPFSSVVRVISGGKEAPGSASIARTLSVSSARPTRFPKRSKAVAVRITGSTDRSDSTSGFGFTSTQTGPAATTSNVRFVWPLSSSPIAARRSGYRWIAGPAGISNRAIPCSSVVAWSASAGPSAMCSVPLSTSRTPTWGAWPRRTSTVSEAPSCTRAVNQAAEVAARRGAVEGAANSLVGARCDSGRVSGRGSASVRDGSCDGGFVGLATQSSMAANIDAVAPNPLRSCRSPRLGMKLRQLRRIMATTSVGE